MHRRSRSRAARRSPGLRSCIRLGMERRVLFAIFLCFLVLYLWQALIVKPVPKSGTATPPAVAGRTPVAGIPAPSGSPAPPDRPVVPGGLPASGTPAVTAPAAAAVVGDLTERDVRVENENVTAVFTNRGARLK